MFLKKQKAAIDVTVALRLCPPASAFGHHRFSVFFHGSFTWDRLESLLRCQHTLTESSHQQGWICLCPFILNFADPAALKAEVRCKAVHHSTSADVSSHICHEEIVRQMDRETTNRETKRQRGRETDRQAEREREGERERKRQRPRQGRRDRERETERERDIQTDRRQRNRNLSETYLQIVRKS